MNVERLYEEIGNTLNNMIPEKWVKIYVYAEISEFYTSVYFYYYPINNNTPVHSLDIENQFSIDNEMYRVYEEKLDEYFEELWERFNSKERWSNITFILEDTGELDIDYGYENLTNANPVETKKRWMKKYLSDYKKI